MASSTLPVGTTLYLRPEDVAQALAEGFYATVNSSADSTVDVEAVDNPDIQDETIPVVTAVIRVVPDEELTGSRASALLRKGVACVLYGRVHFGQVIATSDIAVHVVTSFRRRWLPHEDIIVATSSLLVMLLYDLTLPEARWTEDFVREADKGLTKCLDDAMSCPAMEEVMEAIDKLSAMTPKGAYREWREPRTGLIRATTTDRAMLYTYYVDGKRIIPSYIQPLLGDSIAADPAQLDPNTGVATRTSTKRARAPSGFLASETSHDIADEEEKEGDQAGFSYVAELSVVTTSAAVQDATTRKASHMRASNAPDGRPVTSSMRVAPPPSPVRDAQPDLGW